MAQGEALPRPLDENVLDVNVPIYVAMRATYVGVMICVALCPRWSPHRHISVWQQAGDLCRWHRLMSPAYGDICRHIDGGGYAGDIIRCHQQYTGRPRHRTMSRGRSTCGSLSWKSLDFTMVRGVLRRRHPRMRTIFSLQCEMHNGLRGARYYAASDLTSLPSPPSVPVSGCAPHSAPPVP